MANIRGKIRKYVYLLFMFGVIAVAACTSGTNDQNTDEKTVCTEDAKLCSDGTAVGRDANNNCEFPACPDERTYVANDSEKCKLVRFMCVEGKKPFFDETGCGCEPDVAVKPNETNETTTSGKLKATDCTEEQRNQSCTKEYGPVCGWFTEQIKCIKFPCAANYGNKCTACSDDKVASWTQGECPTTSAPTGPQDSPDASGTVPAGSQNSCADIGGNYDANNNECLSISAEQCQEIGGEFNECASACRNNPDAQICTLQCVQVCKV
jgi:hypothetical protein